MVESADVVAEYVGRGRAAYDSDPAVRDAILYRIVVLGEAAKAALDGTRRWSPSSPASSGLRSPGCAIA